MIWRILFFIQLFQTAKWRKTKKNIHKAVIKSRAAHFYFSFCVYFIKLYFNSWSLIIIEANSAPAMQAVYKWKKKMHLFMLSWNCDWLTHILAHTHTHNEKWICYMPMKWERPTKLNLSILMVYARTMFINNLQFYRKCNDQYNRNKINFYEHYSYRNWPIALHHLCTSMRTVYSMPMFKMIWWINNETV